MQRGREYRISLSNYRSFVQDFFFINVKTIEWERKKDKKPKIISKINKIFFPPSDSLPLFNTTTTTWHLLLALVIIAVHKFYVPTQFVRGIHTLQSLSALY